MEFISLRKQHNWKAPEKRIYTGDDLKPFRQSLAFLRLEKAILTIAQRISNVEIIDNPATSPPVAAICSVISDLSKLHLETPPIVGPRRFGNLAARDWHSKINSQIMNIINLHLSPTIPTDIDIDDFLHESTPYLLNSFGSGTRLDYGTGHELSFISWLGSLFMTHILPLDTPGDQLLWILLKYYDLVKSLILSYTLEPAGSHGVWGLDDHFHLSYFFGACQMISYNDVFPSLETLNAEFTRVDNLPNNVAILASNELGEFSNPNDKISPLYSSRHVAPFPSSSLSMSVIEKLKEKNLYFSSLSFVFNVKKGPFHEHSPILYNIAAAKNWEKVARGLWRMYADEVICKWPVVQHFWFGGVLYPWVSAENALKSYEIDGNKDLVYDYRQEFEWCELFSTFGKNSSTKEINNVESFTKMESRLGVLQTKRNPRISYQIPSTIARK